MDSHRPFAPTSQPVAGLLYGPTATGKTALAVQLAALVPIEVISADSRQVYRDLDIGTAKPTPAERDAVPHHLVGFLALDETYSAARFRADTLALCDAIRARGRLPLVVGGAGFYLHVLRRGLFTAPYDEATERQVRSQLATWSTEALRTELGARDPQRAAAIHANDRYRLARALEICLASGSNVSTLTGTHTASPHPFVECRLVLPRPELHERIAARTAHMLHAGWAEEVATLLGAGHAASLPGLATLGYPHVVAHVQERIDAREMQRLIVRDTRRFARHQETWFRKSTPALDLRVGAAENATRLAECLAPWVPPSGAAG